MGVGGLLHQGIRTCQVPSFCGFPPENRWRGGLDPSCLKAQDSGRPTARPRTSEPLAVRPLGRDSCPALILPSHPGAPPSPAPRPPDLTPTLSPLHTRSSGAGSQDFMPGWGGVGRDGGGVDGGRGRGKGVAALFLDTQVTGIGKSTSRMASSPHMFGT